jgi:azurin
LAACTATTALAADPVAALQIKTLTAQMRYSESELIVRPGQQVKLTFENADDLPHNLVICKPGTDIVALSMKQMDNAEAALKRNWLPDDPRILFHSRMLNPHEKDELTFTAPSEFGDYPFVCTFPGHALTMQGKLQVQAEGKGLQDLSFKLYQGSWKHLPDFDTLQPHREGKVDDNLIQIKLDDYKNEFGVVFTGKLTAPKAATYSFYVTCDDGARLLIDGKQVTEYDGIHPAGAIHQGQVKLSAGDHTFRLDYFQSSGQIALFAGWSGPGFSPTPLSKWVPEGWAALSKKKGKRNEDTSGMPLIVSNEPVLYRNFITNAGQRSIGVGYPGGFNLAWSAESMNLALLWRGAFIDAARHWNSRGGGAQPPLGYDVQQPVGNLAPSLATLAQPTAEWPTYDKDQRYEGYQWLGYHLDAQRLPTFRYTWHGDLVEDRFFAKGDSIKPGGSLERELKITPAPASAARPANTYFLLLAGSIKPGEANSFLLNDHLLVHSHSATPAVLRGPSGKQEVLIPISSAAGQATYTFSYTWLP